MALIQNSSASDMICQNDFYERQCEVKNFDSDSLLFFAKTALTVVHSAIYFIFNYINFVILSVIIFILVYIIYKSFWSPILYVKELTEVGYDHITGPDREKRIARAQGARRAGSKLPPPYPNGWFAVAESVDLKKGDVQAVDALGLNLCVYRGADGTVHCVDAYCPHLGANLAIGGTVNGSCIECPFHKWRFDGKGTCVAAGDDTAPKGVSLRTYHTVEADGAIWFWHDVENRKPLWTLTDAPELAKYGYRGRNEFYVGAHIQEIPENGADVGHLMAVHSPSLLSNLGEKFPILYDIVGRHVWSGRWSCNGDHTANMSLSHHYDIVKCNIFHANVKITQIGPGHVRLLMDTSFGPFLFVQSVTPLGPLLQKVVHRMYTPKRSAMFAWLLIYSESKMIERDIKIWNSKAFVQNPAYVKGDKAIRAFRQWFSQFYSENSKTFRDCMQNPLEW